MTARNQPMNQYESRPSPDPTVLTTQALEREILAVREVITTRFIAAEKADALLSESLEHYRKSIQDEIVSLKELHAEKFSSIETQFKERDTRTDKTSQDSKIAVDAAFAAAKEAVGAQNTSNSLAIAKSEAATTKQLDQILSQLQTMGKTFDDKIADLKDRLTGIENRQEGRGRQREDSKSTAIVAATILGVSITAATTLIGIALYVSRPVPASQPVPVQVTNTDSSKVPVKQ